MTKALLTVPAIMLIIVSAATQLEEIALDSSEKAIAFSDDMNGAMDCAAEGRLLRECSPNLFDHDFSEEKDRFITTLEELESELNQTNSTEI